MIFSVVWHSHKWLVAGALASALIYSGTAVIHALILACVSGNSVYDLDALGIWALVSVGCILAFPGMSRLTIFLQRPSQPILEIWGFFNTLGSLFVLRMLLGRYSSEPECRSDEGSLLTSDIQQPHGLNCTYSCFKSKHTLRASTDVTVVSRRRLYGPTIYLVVPSYALTGFGVWIGLIAYCLVLRKRTEAEPRTIIERNSNCSMINWRIKSRKIAALKEPTTVISSKLEFLIWMIVVAVIAINETYLLRDGGLPTTEGLYVVGQWGPWAGVVLTLLAAALVRYRRPKLLERQSILDEERAALELRKRAHGVPVERRTTEDGVSQPTIPLRTSPESKSVQTNGLFSMLRRPTV